MTQFCIICREEKDCQIIGEELNFNGFILHAFFHWCTPCEENCRRKHENANVVGSGGFGSPSDGGGDVTDVDADEEEFEWWWWYRNEVDNDDDAGDDVLDDYVPSPSEDWDMELWIISNNDHRPF